MRSAKFIRLRYYQKINAKNLTEKLQNVDIASALFYNCMVIKKLK
jgi:hypothetical protein